MNKLQKEILEIIEPYTDKTLSQGCLIWTGNMKDIIYQIVGKETEHFTRQFKVCDLLDTRRWWVINGKISNSKHIYWHYEITAVSKYIWKRVYHIDLDINQEYFEVSIISDDLVAQNFYFIPNKPLSLYTEQENISLLKLLWKIVKQ